jgi:hypothetical protein
MMKRFHVVPHEIGSSVVSQKLLTQVSHPWIKRMTCVRGLFSITDKRGLSEKAMILCIRRHASIRDHEDYHGF